VARPAGIDLGGPTAAATAGVASGGASSRLGASADWKLDRTTAVPTPGALL
jgi:hypothetical protein